MPEIINPSKKDMQTYAKYFRKSWSYRYTLLAPHRVGLVQVKKDINSSFYYRRLYFSLVSKCLWTKCNIDKKSGSKLGISPEFVHYTVLLEQFISGPLNLWEKPDFGYSSAIIIGHMPKVISLIHHNPLPINDHRLYWPIELILIDHRFPFESKMLNELIKYVRNFEKKSRIHWKSKKIIRQKSWENFVKEESKKIGPICGECGRRGPWRFNKKEFDGDYNPSLSCSSCHTSVIVEMSNKEAAYWKKELKKPNNPIIARQRESFEERRKRRNK